MYIKNPIYRLPHQGKVEQDKDYAQVPIPRMHWPMELEQHRKKYMLHPVKRHSKVAAQCVPTKVSQVQGLWDLRLGPLLSTPFHLPVCFALYRTNLPALGRNRTDMHRVQIPERAEASYIQCGYGGVQATSGFSRHSPFWSIAGLRTHIWCAKRKRCNSF